MGSDHQALVLILADFPSAAAGGCRVISLKSLLMSSFRSSLVCLVGLLNMPRFVLKRSNFLSHSLYKEEEETQKEQ